MNSSGGGPCRPHWTFHVLTYRGRKDLAFPDNGDPQFWLLSESSWSVVKIQTPGSALQEPLYFLLLPKTNTPEPLPFRRVERNN